MIYPIHPVADIFPMLSELELKELSDDIKENGLNDPIVIYEGTILDGRNRIRACEMACVEPRFRQYEGSNPAQFIVSTNLHRRQLTTGQKAVVAMGLESYFTEEARKRMLSTLKHGEEKPAPELIPERVRSDARDQAAALVGISGKTVSDAKRVERESPERFEKIKDGTLTVSRALGEARQEHLSKKTEAPKADDDSEEGRNKRLAFNREESKRKAIEAGEIKSSIKTKLKKLLAMLSEEDRALFIADTMAWLESQKESSGGNR